MSTFIPLTLMLISIRDESSSISLTRSAVVLPVFQNVPFLSESALSPSRIENDWHANTHLTYIAFIFACHNSINFLTFQIQKNELGRPHETEPKSIKKSQWPLPFCCGYAILPHLFPLEYGLVF
jgi:hypothetical protein